MLKVLITGFEPFNKAKLNPSEQLVLRLDKHDVNGAEIITKVLPVVYSEAARELLQLIDEHKPDAVICFGMAEGRKNISVERFAVNLDDAAIADNSGEIRVNQKIHEAGPTAFESTLPIEKILADLKKNDIPASQSLSAGAFVCNHIFYELQNALVGMDVVSGFVHVPLMHEQQEDFPGLPTMDIHNMVNAARSIVSSLVTSN
ncbi:MAG: pyroglutamyl-peptidase I [Rhodoluna sp.]